MDNDLFGLVCPYIRAIRKLARIKIQQHIVTDPTHLRLPPEQALTVEKQRRKKTLLKKQTDGSRRRGKKVTH